LNHRKKTKADGSRLIPRKHTETLVLLSEMSEIYLWHLHSLMPVFHTHIQTVERASNSVVEVLISLESIHKILEERK